MKLSIAYCTVREKPMVSWFANSLLHQVKSDDDIEVLIVSPDDPKLFDTLKLRGGAIILKMIQPKPTVWSGPHRLTKENFWSKSNSLNTAICVAKHPWFATMDDRSVILPGWLDHVRTMIEAPQPYVLCGGYEKRVSLTVENGFIKNAGIITGKDGRADYCEKYWPTLTPPYKCPGEWTYGCSIVAPLEWMLEIGGFDETNDGASHEDSIAGLMLQNNGYPIYYEPRMTMVEDRTPGECQPVVHRRDYGISPNDYSHKKLDLLKDRKSALHGFNIRELRQNAQRGKPWPKPWGPTHHLWDGKPLGELE